MKSFIISQDCLENICRKKKLVFNILSVLFIKDLIRLKSISIVNSILGDLTCSKIKLNKVNCFIEPFLVKI